MVARGGDPADRSQIINEIMKRPGIKRKGQWVLLDSPHRDIYVNTWTTKPRPGAVKFAFSGNDIKPISIVEGSDPNEPTISIMDIEKIPDQLREEFVAVAIAEVQRDIAHIDAVIERYDTAAARLRSAIDEANKRLSHTAR
jgi:hypothetical protein